MSAVHGLLALLFTVLLAALLPPGLVLLAELWAAPRRWDTAVAPAPAAAVRPRVAVVVPAHDEGEGLAPTLLSLAPQLRPGDRLLVVADNCSDDTADVARRHGAEVHERRDAARRGKGYALDAGVRALDATPPQVVVFVDADCVVAPGSLDALADQVRRTDAPAQALNLMHAPAGAPLGTRIAAFAWIVRNAVRPAGAARLGWPCQLTGTGMALPWPLLDRVPLASGHLAEDMELGVAAARCGAPPRFCPAARVGSDFPLDRSALRTQRQRWEAGHLAMALRRGLPLLAEGLAGRRLPQIALTLDLLVPPLVLWLLSNGIAVAAAGTWWWLGGQTVGAIVFAAFAILFGSTLAGLARAWWRHARPLLSARELLGLPFYVAAKLPLYARLLRRRPAGWVRTGRDGRRG